MKNPVTLLQEMAAKKKEIIDKQRAMSEKMILNAEAAKAAAQKK